MEDDSDTTTWGRTPSPPHAVGHSLSERIAYVSRFGAGYFLALNPIELSFTTFTSSFKCHPHIHSQTFDDNYPKALLSHVSTVSSVFTGFSTVGHVEGFPA